MLPKDVACSGQEGLLSSFARKKRKDASETMNKTYKAKNVVQREIAHV